jgi:hypothetical protein
MPEQQVETPKSSEIDLTQYVPKSEHEAKLFEFQKSLDNLKNDVNQKELELLDPEYLKYKESKAVVKPATVATRASDSPEMVELKAEINQLRTENQNISSAVTKLLQKEEIADCQKRYPDFEEYRDDMISFFKTSNTDLSYEYAYKLCKQNRLDQEASKTPKTEPKRHLGGEKPSATVPLTTLETKKFKSEKEANQATIREFRDRNPHVGDTI